MSEASLINRGEQFSYVEDGERYEGECVWAWTPTEPGTPPKRTWPLTIVVRSIRATGGTGAKPPIRLGHDRQQAIARQVKRILEAREPGCEILLVETPSPVPRRSRR